MKNFADLHFLFLFLLLPLITPVRGQAQIGLQPQLRLDEARILPFEPVTGIIELKNTSDTSQSFISDGLQGVSILLPKRNEWFIYSRSEPSASSPIPTQRTLFSGEKIEQETVIDIYKDTQHIFDQPGIYSVRSWFKINDALAESEPVGIVVTSPTTVDIAAYKALAGSQLYLYFQPDTAAALVADWRVTSKYKNPVDVALELDKFAKAHPKSLYSDWANLASLVVQRALIERSQKVFEYNTNSPKNAEWLKQELGDSTYTKLLELHVRRTKSLRDVVRSLQSLSLRTKPNKPLLAAYALYQAGVASAQANDKAEASAEFEQATRAYKSRFLLFRIDLMSRLYQIPSSSAAQSNSATQILENLSREGYNVAEFLRDFPMKSPEGFKEYASEVNRLSERITTGEIKQSEYIDIRAKLLRDYIRKYGQLTK